MNIKRAIRFLWRASGLEAKEIAGKMGVHVTALYQKAQKGHTNPSLDFLVRMGSALGLKPYETVILAAPLEEIDPERLGKITLRLFALSGNKEKE